MEKVKAQRVELKESPADTMPWEALIAEDTILTSGTWMSLTEARIDGVILGLELANFEVDLQEMEIISKELKSSLDEEQILEHVRKHKSK